MSTRMFTLPPCTAVAVCRLALVLAAAVIAPTGSAAAQTVAMPDEHTVADAYTSLLGRLLVLRQEHIDLKEPGIAYNVVQYNPLGSADFVNPNLDVAYLEAWFAVDDRTPVLLDVPQVKDRYDTAQILDEWGAVIANINERTFPSKPYGQFALVKPGSTAQIPADAGRIARHSSKAKLLARVELRDDPEGAVRLQKQFTVTPLGNPAVTPPPAIPMFDNKSLLGVEMFDKVDATLASALDVSPIAAALQQQARTVAAYVASGPEARAAIDRQLRSKVIPAFHEYALTKSAIYRNNWRGGPVPGGGLAGNFGKDSRLRTVVSLIGIWAHTPDEAQYFVATRDADGKPLDGSNRYVIHFPADQLPGSVTTAGYRSIVLVSVPDYRVVPNPLKRYNVNNHSKLAQEADGSLKIAVGPEPVRGVPESNWLPAAAGKPFSLTWRTYVPKDLVKRGEWSPPPVTLAQ